MSKLCRCPDLPVPKLLTSLILSVLFVGAGARFAFASGHLDNVSQGCDALRKKNYAFALQYFNAAARQSPERAEAHFGRAVALKSLGRKDEAVREFKLSLLLNPSAQIKQQCEKQLLDNGVGRAGAPSNPAPPTITARDVEKSVTTIMNQARDRIRLIQTSSGRYLNDIYRPPVASSSLSSWSGKNVCTTLGNTYPINPMSTFAGILLNSGLPYRHASYRPAYYQRTQDTTRRARAIQEWAESLSGALVTKPAAASGVYMVPQNSNLYVQNYAHFDPVLPEPPEPLQAKAGKYHWPSAGSKAGGP